MITAHRHKRQTAHKQEFVNDVNEQTKFVCFELATFYS